MPILSKRACARLGRRPSRQNAALCVVAHPPAGSMCERNYFYGDCRNLTVGRGGRKKSPPTRRRRPAYILVNWPWAGLLNAAPPVQASTAGFLGCVGFLLSCCRIYFKCPPGFLSGSMAGGESWGKGAGDWPSPHRGGGLWVNCGVVGWGKVRGTKAGKRCRWFAVSPQGWRHSVKLRGFGNGRRVKRRGFEICRGIA